MATFARLPGRAYEHRKEKALKKIVALTIAFACYACAVCAVQWLDLLLTLFVSHHQRKKTTHNYF